MKIFRKIIIFIFPTFSKIRKYIIHLDDMDMLSRFQELIEHKLYSGIINVNNFKLIERNRLLDSQSFYGIKILGELEKNNVSTFLTLRFALTAFWEMGRKLITYTSIVTIFLPFFLSESIMQIIIFVSTGILILVGSNYFFQNRIEGAQIRMKDFMDQLFKPGELQELINSR